MQEIVSDSVLYNACFCAFHFRGVEQRAFATPEDDARGSINDEDEGVAEPDATHGIDGAPRLSRRK